MLRGAANQSQPILTETSQSGKGPPFTHISRQEGGKESQWINTSCWCFNSIIRKIGSKHARHKFVEYLRNTILKSVLDINNQIPEFSDPWVWSFLDISLVRKFIGSVFNSRFLRNKDNYFLMIGLKYKDEHKISTTGKRRWILFQAVRNLNFKIKL